MQDTACNCAIAWNWRQNALHNCCFSKNSSKQSAELQFYLNWLVRSETCRYLQIWNFCANQFSNYELLKIRVFCQKREDDNILTKYSHCLTSSSCEKGRSTINLRKLVCVVNNIQETSICCFRSNFCKTACVNLLFATVVLLQIGNFC